MASKRRIRRKMCDGKHKYKDGVTAREGAREAIRRTGHRIGAYKCQFCKQWHMGHTPSSVRRAMKWK